MRHSSKLASRCDVEAVDRACEALKERGAKRAIRLNVSAPFHCALMYPAQEKLAEELSRIEFRDLKFETNTCRRGRHT